MRMNIIMPEFQSYFEQSRAKPIEYKGKTTYLADRIMIPAPGTFTLTFESAASDWEQGVCLHAKGKLRFGDKTYGTDLILWKATCPRVAKLSLVKPDDELIIYNAWHYGNSNSVDAGHNGAAMQRESLPNGFRYCCNDGLADDDFDDLIFTITWP